MLGRRSKIQMDTLKSMEEQKVWADKVKTGLITIENIGKKE
jgi:hypothetical protein